MAITMNIEQNKIILYQSDGGLASVANNYLSQEEIHRLRLAVTVFLDIAQSRAERKIPTDMRGWLGIMGKA